MTLDREKLLQMRADAGTAADGPWVVDKARPGVVLMPSVDSFAGILCGRNAAHVANCDPQTVIALIDEVLARDSMKGQP